MSKSDPQRPTPGGMPIGRARPAPYTPRRRAPWTLQHALRDILTSSVVIGVTAVSLIPAIIAVAIWFS